MESSAPKLSRWQLEVLQQFAGLESEWVRPMDLGATNGSVHSVMLARLEAKGLVVSKQRSSGVRGSKLYHITASGLRVAGLRKELRNAADT